MGGTQAGKRGPAPLLRMCCEGCCEPEAPAAAEAEPRLAAGTGCQIASGKGTVSLEGSCKLQALSCELAAVSLNSFIFGAADFKFRLDPSHLSRNISCPSTLLHTTGNCLCS